MSSAWLALASIRATTRRSFDLSGKVAVVTGGNGGIGLGMARGLAWAGATIVIAARNLKKSQAAVEAVASHGASASAILVDVTQEASFSALFSATLERCGRLDILVNNAGTNIRHPAHQLSLAEWHTVIDTNLTSAFMCAKAAYPIFKRGGGGKIINIGSRMVSIWRLVCACLCGQQGRHRSTDALARQRLGARQRSGQRRSAGVDRHRFDPRRPRAGPGTP